jgi:hypothetical protein
MNGDNQEKKQDKQPWLKDYRWKPGKSGNLKGRPKGPTLKEWARQFLLSLPDDKKLDFLKLMEPDVVWKMAEGSPQTDITSGGDKIVPMPILGGATDVHTNDSSAKDTPA